MVLKIERIFLAQTMVELDLPRSLGTFPFAEESISYLGLHVGRAYSVGEFRAFVNLIFVIYRDSVIPGPLDTTTSLLVITQL